MHESYNKQPRIAWLGLFAILVTAGACTAQDDGQPAADRFRGRLGPASKKVKIENGKTYIWAGPDAWFDFTGAPIDPYELQFGIGKDRIRSIDDPFFVKPDDKRLLSIPRSRYRRDETPKSADEIMVIGYAVGDDVRAYPTALLDVHELVNDTIGGKPVTVGW
jgi:hypothetical protein